MSPDTLQLLIAIFPPWNISIEGLTLGMKQSIWYFVVVQHIFKALDLESEIYMIMNFPEGEHYTGSY